MAGFDDLDALGRRAMAVAGDDQPFERSAPMGFDRGRHGGRGLAGADDDRAAFGRRREMGRHAMRRRRRFNRGGEHALEQRAMIGGHERFRPFAGAAGPLPYPPSLRGRGYGRGPAALIALPFTRPSWPLRDWP